MPRKQDPSTNYRVRVHKIGQYRYACTQPRVSAREPGKEAHKYVHWGRLDENNKVIPSSAYLLASPEERKKLIFPEDWDLSLLDFSVESGSGEGLPSIDDWLEEAKAGPEAGKCGMYLFHNGVVRETSRQPGAPVVKAVLCSNDLDKAVEAREAALKMPGIHYVRVWLNNGELKVGESLMCALVGGDTRRNVIKAMETLLQELKSGCIAEEEIY